MDLSEAIKIKDPGNVMRHPWETARIRIVAFLLSQHSNMSFSHLVDIGSGDGFILKHLLETGKALNFSAIDPFFGESDFRRMSAWTHSKNLRLYKKIEDLKSQALSVDCVIMLDVLEHVADDQKLIIEIFKNAPVVKNATWLITVPAFQSLFSKHDEQLNHYRRYNLKTLTTLCNNCGLKIYKSGYFFFSLIPLRLLQKLILKFSRKESISTIENWKGGKAVGKIVETVLWIDFRICFLLSKSGINIPGLSCYCLCR